MEEQAPIPLDIIDLVRSWPRETQIYIGLFAVTWLIGGNIVVALHYKRVGKPWWSGFKPFAFPWRDFNGREWAMLGILAFVALTFGSCGINAQ